MPACRKVPAQAHISKFFLYNIISEGRKTLWKGNYEDFFNIY